jgi:hypothetical protein
LYFVTSKPMIELKINSDDYWNCNRWYNHYNNNRSNGCLYNEKEK